MADEAPGPGSLAQALLAWRECPGDDDALNAVLGACRERISFLASKLLATAPQVGRWEQTDDLVQNASLRLLVALQATAIESERHLLNLAAKKIREEFIDKFRHYSGPRAAVRWHETNSLRGPDGELVDRAGQASASDLTSAAEREQWQRFHAAVDSLQPDARDVFRMAWYLGADQKTIAQSLGCSVSTVGRLWKDARAQVQTATAGSGSA